MTGDLRVLSGIKVLDLSRVLAGPWSTQILADFGADVVKVEAPGRGDDTRAWGSPIPALDPRHKVAGESAMGDFVISLNQYLAHGQPVYLALYGLGIVFFCFFYTAVVFNPEETSENLKKAGGFIPGIRPGKNTESYLDYVLTRITVLGAAYLTLVCLLPDYVMAQTGQQQFFAIGGTSLLILVNVTIDTISQIQSHLLAHQYGDLLKKAKLKGGRAR